LRSVAIGELRVLQGLRRLLVDGGLLEVVIAVDADRDRTEVQRLGLPNISLDYLTSVLEPRYAASRLAMKEKGKLAANEWPHLQSSWARRLSGNDRREVVYFIAEAQK
jgi:hypothetical protein